MGADGDRVFLRFAVVVESADVVETGAGIAELAKNPEEFAGKIYELAVARGPRVLGSLAVLIIGMI